MTLEESRLRDLVRRAALALSDAYPIALAAPAEVRAIIDEAAALEQLPPRSAAAPCDHGITFDSSAAVGMKAEDVRARWPRFQGSCRCGFNGIAYASLNHFWAGNW